MGRRKKYRLYKNGCYIGEFYANELFKMINITSKTFYSCVENGDTYKCYKFKEKNEYYTREYLELLNEWDKYRKILNPHAKGVME